MIPPNFPDREIVFMPGGIVQMTYSRSFILSSSPMAWIRSLIRSSSSFMFCSSFFVSFKSRCDYSPANRLFSSWIHPCAISSCQPLSFSQVVGRGILSFSRFLQSDRLRYSMHRMINIAWRGSGFSCLHNSRARSFFSFLGYTGQKVFSKKSSARAKSRLTFSCEE